MTDQPTPRAPESDRLSCADCGLPYGDPGWCDTHIPDDAWLRISPTGHHGGVLCLTCMARRLVAAGVDDVPLKVTSGPWRTAPEPSAPDDMRERVAEERYQAGGWLSSAGPEVWRETFRQGWDAAVALGVASSGSAASVTQADSGPRRTSPGVARGASNDAAALWVRLDRELFVHLCGGYHLTDGHRAAVLAVVMAVMEPALAQRDAEIAALNSECERLNDQVVLMGRTARERDEARAALAQRDAEIERLRQLSVINDPQAAWDTETARLHAELAEARRVIAAVEALCDEAERPRGIDRGPFILWPARVRAVLASGDGTGEQR